MLYGIKAFGRKYGWILLGSTQADTYFVFCQILDIAFENHFIGDIICITVSFIKDNGVALTEIRKESFSMKHLTSSGKSKSGFIFIGGMVLLYFQIINDFSSLTFLRQCREPQRSCPCTSLIIHVTGFWGIKFLCYKVVHRIEVILFQCGKSFQLRLKVINRRTQVCFPETPFQSSFIQGGSIDFFQFLWRILQAVS